MEIKRIKAPEGVVELMKELWTKHHSGQGEPAPKIYMVDLPRPTETEEEMRIMAINRIDREPYAINDADLETAVVNSVGLLGGW